MTEKYERVLITSIYDKKETGLSKIPISTEKDYHKEYKKNPKGICDFVGLNEFQVKPYFDLDPKGEDFDYSIFDDFESDLLKKCPNAIINISGREPREQKMAYKTILKHSRRFFIEGYRISYYNIPIYFKDLFEKYGEDIIDFGVYDKNQRLFAPLTKFKRDLEVPELKILNGSLFGCCASYIKEDYEDLDLKIQVSKPEPKKEDFITKLCDDDETEIDCKLNFFEIVSKYSKERATDYKTWINVGISLMNLSYRKIISRGQVYDIFDLFSSKADNYDSNGVNKFLETNFPRFDGKGYGIKYLLDCLKTDDIDFYKSITKKDLIIDGANDDIGASEIVVNYYKESLIICKGILYVNDNDIWAYNEKQVNNLLIDMIGKLDIKFYGADRKRKYQYNKSIKHIKDCIVCIKANKSIINDKFYDNMIKNNKFYLPFNDGIYSFKDKKLFKYNELPNIHFTYKINRNFPKFNKKDYKELMDRVIIPIYPNEDEKNYNAHIKARALAGCYEDKKWYGYSGSRNSGKGTETGILKNAFGDFVMEFNAKCLVLTKFVNPDSAKSLSWVVDKRNARIIISNEIDGDENTILNGAFIKTLASGGDTMEGRKNYQDEISFIPQFTMFLCYNKFYKVEPFDATENLEQFEYKSKFVERHELIEGVSFLKLKDDNIKDFIKEDRIIDAYTLYILNAFTDPRIKTPEVIKNSTEINNGNNGSISVETFIIKNFKTTNDDKDRIHTETICDILNDNGYKINIIETGKLMNRTGIGKYNKYCNINKLRKSGYDYIKYEEQIEMMSN